MRRNCFLLLGLCGVVGCEGPAGPVGPAGNEGARGPVGAQGEEGPAGLDSTVRVLSASANGGAGPVGDAERFWVDDCLTAAYTAGADETALVTASGRLVLDTPAQGDLIVVDVVDGVATEHGNGLLWFDTDLASASVMGSIRLTEGVTYRFGPGALVQGGGVEVELFGCQTLAQIVRTP